VREPASSLAEQTELGGADPQVAFSARGTALFAALVFVRDARGGTHAALHFHRSEDGGLTWAPAADLGYSYDHDQMVVDQTVGTHAGRIYVGAVYGSVDTVGVFRSDDDARQFQPALAVNKDGVLGITWFDTRKPALNDGSKAVDRTAAKKPSQPTRIETELSERIEFIFDPASYDMATREVALPVRIRNSTKQTILPPVRVEVVEFGSGKGNVDREFAPQVLNASNGKAGVGAWFDFSPALGTRQRLEPGDVSGPIVWRMRLAEPTRTSDLHLRVFTQVEQ
jgi:hypothetical protein